MMYDLPTVIEIDGKECAIRNKGDYRIILDCMNALNDTDMTEQERAYCALVIFYEDITAIPNYQKATDSMLFFIGYGENDKTGSSPQLMDWEQDFKHISGAINKTRQQDIRSLEYLHWWSFLDLFFEIGDSTFANIVAIRNKRSKGQKLEKWESDFYSNNRQKIDLKIKYTAEEQAWFDNEW